MTDRNLNFKNDALTIVVLQSDDRATIRWMGESDARNPGEFLNPIFSQLVKELQGLPIAVDFSALEYMNSATVSPLITCVKSFDGAGSAVQVIFSDVDWQRTHVQCMRTIARTLKHVTIEVRPARKGG